MAMIEFQLKNGKRMLVNRNNICTVVEETKGANSCVLQTADGEQWYIVGSIEEVDIKIWEAETE